MIPDPEVSHEYSDADSDVEGQMPMCRVCFGGQTVRPSAALQSLFVLTITEPYFGPTMKQLYQEFRRSGPNSFVMNMQDPPHRMNQSLFDEIEHPHIQFSAEVRPSLILYYYYL